MVILDTDLVTLISRRDSEPSIRLSQRLELLNGGRVITTIITYEEQMRGWLSYVAKAKTVVGQVEAYSRLVKHVEFYRDIPVLPFGGAAAVEFQRLVHHRIRIGTMDLKIAAVALSLNATLLSRNLRDFKLVLGLDVQDWSS